MGGLRFHKFSASSWFGVDDDGNDVLPLVSDPDGQSHLHLLYMYNLLDRLRCTSVIEEQVYIDREFNEEFSEFYGATPTQPSVTCRRLHFFDSGPGDIGEEVFLEFVSGRRAIEELQDAYLGFSVIRPRGIAPFGRTALRTPNQVDRSGFPLLGPGRRYSVHLCGLRLSVRCVLWQQQDAGVSACAGVAMWSMLQSVAGREGIADPSTVRVARAATRYSLPFGRALPPGLSMGQLCEGIREFGLAPVVVDGNYENSLGNPTAFKGDYLLRLCKVLIRGRLPCLLAIPSNHQGREGHAVLAVGMMETIDMSGEAVTEILVHDDNYGPVLPHLVQTIRPSECLENGVGISVLSIDNVETPEKGKRTVTPSRLLYAAPNQLRLSATELLESEVVLLSEFQTIANQSGLSGSELRSDSGFVLLTDYQRFCIMSAIGANQGAEILILKLQEAHPLPRYIGVVRVWRNGAICADVLYDTTAAPKRPRICAWISFDKLSLQTALNFRRQIAANIDASEFATE